MWFGVASLSVSSDGMTIMIIHKTRKVINICDTAAAAAQGQQAQWGYDFNVTSAQRYAAYNGIAFANQQLNTKTALGEGDLISRCSSWGYDECSYQTDFIHLSRPCMSN